MWSRKIHASVTRHFRLGFEFSVRRYSTAGIRFAALWGNGDYGRLGLGNLDSQWRPSSVPPFAVAVVVILFALLLAAVLILFFLQLRYFQLSHETVLQWHSYCFSYSYHITESGRVYASGLNDFGQLGISNDLNYTMEPALVPGIEKEIKHISAGYSHSCAVTSEGELYMWGKNSNGQLGLGKSAPKIVPSPSKVPYLGGINIKMADLGLEHSIAVTDEGVTLSWGGGSSGVLGHDRQSSLLGFLSSGCEFTPRVIKRLDGVKVKVVAAGLLHSACVDENGNAFVFGVKAADKLSFGSSTGLSVLSALPVSEEISCGGYHTCVITSNKELYTWGTNENGCLGIGCTDVIQSPQRVEDPFARQSVSKVSCGWKHTAAISDGYVFTWGWGGSHGTFSVDGQSSGGQLGCGSDVDYVKPALVDFGSNVKALEVSCGFNHTGAILEYI